MSMSRDEVTYLPDMGTLDLGTTGLMTHELDTIADWDAGVEVAGAVSGPLWEGFRGLTKSNKQAHEMLSKMPRKADVTPLQAYRGFSPGVYADPREIARIANTRADPDSGAMGRVFGPEWSRDSLYDLHKGREAQYDLGILFPPGAKGSAPARNVTNKRNTDRLIDIMTEAREYPRLYQGSQSWYEMQPLYDRLAQLTDDPTTKFWDLVNTTSVMSPRSSVLSEIERGTHALMLRNQGRVDEFRSMGAIAAPLRGADFPEDLLRMPGAMAHKVHSGMLENLDKTGRIVTDEAKVPMYAKAHGVPETGGQTIMGAPDAHNARMIGLSDVRLPKKGKQGGNANKPETFSLLPWFDSKVARPMDMSGSDAQSLLWNVGAPFTGVATQIGKSKLELLSEGIERAAQHYGISVEQARDRVIMGDLGIPNLNINIPKGR